MSQEAWNENPLSGSRIICLSAWLFVGSYVIRYPCEDYEKGGNMQSGYSWQWLSFKRKKNSHALSGHILDRSFIVVANAEYPTSPPDRYCISTELLLSTSAIA